MRTLDLCCYIAGGLMALLVPSNGLRVAVVFALVCAGLSLVANRFGAKWSISFGCFCIGMVVAGFQFLIFNHQKVSLKHSRIVEGCVMSSIKRKPASMRFVFEERTNTWVIWPSRFLVSVHLPTEDLGAKLAQFEPGSCWRLNLKMRAGRSSSNEVGFDFERWLFAQRIHGVASLNDLTTADRLRYDNLQSRHLRLRHKIYQQILQLIPDRSVASLIGALAVGIREDVTPEQWIVLQRTGTAHLMAISGLHIGLAAMIGYALGRYVPIGIGLGSNLLRRGTAVALVFAFVYAALAGFSTPTVRAITMLILWSIFRLMSVNVSSLLVLLMTVVIVITANPFSFAGNSVWLSIGAVSIIILVSQSISGDGGKTGGFKRRLIFRFRYLIMMQIALMLFLLPIGASISGGVSWASIPMNILIVPLFTFLIVPFVLLLLFSLVLIGPVQAAVANVLAVMVKQIWMVLVWVSAQSWSFSQISNISLVATVPLCITGCLFLVFRNWPIKIPMVALSLPLFIGSPAKPSVGQLWIDVLDVGQALAVLIQTHSAVVLYDTGNSWRDGDSATQTILPLLHRRGIHKVDDLIVSHADRDHSGGAHSLINKMSVSRIWLGEPVLGLNETESCHQGMGWNYNDFSFEFLHPDFDGQFDGNEQSCVLLIRGPDALVLLTGDLGGILERRILGRLKGHQVPLVIGAHHGSLGSSDHRFVAGIGAHYVVFSSGYENQWGMPRPQIVNRWQDVGTVVLKTAEFGQIGFEVDQRQRIKLTRRQRIGKLGVWRWQP